MLVGTGKIKNDFNYFHDIQWLVDLHVYELMMYPFFKMLDLESYHYDEDLTKILFH